MYEYSNKITLTNITIYKNIFQLHFKLTLRITENLSYKRFSNY